MEFNFTQLVLDMEKANMELDDVDVSVCPSDEDLRLYEAIADAARSLLAKANYILNGD